MPGFICGFRLFYCGFRNLHFWITLLLPFGTFSNRFELNVKDLNSYLKDLDGIPGNSDGVREMKSRFLSCLVLIRAGSIRFTSFKWLLTRRQRTVPWAVPYTKQIS